MAEKDTKLELRRLRKGDEDKLVEIYREVFGVELGVPYWQWKYLENPYGEPIMYVALDGARIVGEIGGILCQVKVGGREALALQIVDIVILAEYQKGGPFFKLEKLARQAERDEGVLLSYAISIKRTYKISTRILKFRGVSPIKRFIKVLDPSPYLKKKMGPMGGIVGGAGKLGLSVLRPGRLSVDRELKVIEITGFDKRFDDLWDRVGPGYNIAVVRSSEYLEWRYSRCPINDYKVFAAVAGERLDGYIICASYMQEGIKKGRIVDIFVEKGNMGSVGLLINRSIDFFREEGCAVAVTWGFESGWLSSIFQKANFAVKDTPHDLIARVESDLMDIDYLTDADNWHINMGDSDYF